ncbi:MAG: hypothetical protein AB7I41_14505 [Candidatus Sericytochromatia bacterium]
MQKPLPLSILTVTLLSLLSLSPVQSQTVSAPFQVAQSSTAPLAEGVEHLKDYNYSAVWALLTRESQADLVRFLALWTDWREMPHEELQALLINDDHHLHRQAWGLLREKLQWPEQFALPQLIAVYEDGRKKLRWRAAELALRTRGQIHTYTLRYENDPLDTYPVYPSPKHHLVEGCWAGKPRSIGGEGSYDAFWAVHFFKQISATDFIYESTYMTESPDYEPDGVTVIYGTGLRTNFQYTHLLKQKDQFGHQNMRVFDNKKTYLQKASNVILGFEIKNKNEMHIMDPWGKSQIKLVRCGPETIQAVYLCRDASRTLFTCRDNLYGPTIEGPKKITQVHDRQPLVGYHESPGSNYQP